MAVDETAGRVFLAPFPTGSTLSILDARTGASLRTVTLGGSIVGLAVDETGAGVLVETAAPHRYGVSILDPRSGAIRHTTILGGASIVRAIPLLQPGQTLSAGLVVDERTGHAFVITGGTNRSGSTLSGHGRVTMLDARSGRVLHTATIAAFPIAAVVDTRAGRLLVADGTHGPVNAVSVLDTHSGAFVRSVRVRAVGVSFFMAVPLAVDAHSGRAFVVNRSSNSVSVLATRSGTRLRSVALRPAPVAP